MNAGAASLRVVPIAVGEYQDVHLAEFAYVQAESQVYARHTSLAADAQDGSLGPFVPDAPVSATFKR